VNLSQGEGSGDNFLALRTFGNTLFNLDNHTEILLLKFSDGTPIWPILRWQLRLANMKSQKSELKTLSRPSEESISLWKYIWFCFCNKPSFNVSPDILSIANYEGNPDIPNRMTVFLKQLGEFKCEEWLYSGKRRKFNNLKDTASFDYIFYKSWIGSKLKIFHNREANQARIVEFTKNIETQFNSSIDSQSWRVIREELFFIDKVIAQYRKEIKNALKKKAPKFILTSEGNNGEWKQSVLFQVAKELNIPTAEVQHGVFNIGMKYGDKLAHSKGLKQLKSDYQFVFGPYHETLTNAPVKCIPFGHYDLQKSLQSLKEHNVERNPNILNILFVCEGTPPSSVNNGLIKHTYAALKKLTRPFRLLVRLHPSESPSELYTDLFDFEGTRYSDYQSESIHKVIDWADCVISHASTVVFEALYFNKPVFVLRDENTDQYIPKDIGFSFSGVEELYSLLSQNIINQENLENDNYWTRSPVEDNFRSFWKYYIAV